MKGLPRSQQRGNPLQQEVIKIALPVHNLEVAVAAAGAAVGFGTAVLAGLPQGNILLLGAVSYLQFSTSDADISATFDGDYGIGTAPTVDADLGDAEDDNLVPSTALGAATAKLSPNARGASTTTEQGAIIDNTDGSKELNLNLLIDAADIADGASANFLANGVLHLAYIVLGDD